MDDAQLRTVWQQRQGNYRLTPLAEPLAVLMKQKLARRVRRLGELARLWDDMIPEAIRDHTALEGFHQGVLTVMVDSASQRFHLQTLLTGGLLRQMQEAFSGTLQKVRLLPGQFYSVDLETGRRRYDEL
jgi:hypothetical protein